jgi:hypothetical protein
LLKGADQRGTLCAAHRRAASHAEVGSRSARGPRRKARTRVVLRRHSCASPCRESVERSSSGVPPRADPRRPNRQRLKPRVSSAEHFPREPFAALIDSHVTPKLITSVRFVSEGRGDPVTHAAQALIDRRLLTRTTRSSALAALMALRSRGRPSCGWRHTPGQKPGGQAYLDRPHMKTRVAHEPYWLGREPILLPDLSVAPRDESSPRYPPTVVVTAPTPMAESPAFAGAFLRLGQSHARVSALYRTVCRRAHTRQGSNRVPNLLGQRVPTGTRYPRVAKRSYGTGRLWRGTGRKPPSRWPVRCGLTIHGAVHTPVPSGLLRSVRHARSNGPSLER